MTKRERQYHTRKDTWKSWLRFKKFGEANPEKVRSVMICHNAPANGQPVTVTISRQALNK